MGSKDDDRERGYRELLDGLAKESREPSVSRALSPLPPPPNPAKGPPPPRPRGLWWRLIARLFLLFVNVSVAAGEVLGAVAFVATTGSLGELPLKLAPVMILGAVAAALGLAGFANGEPLARAKLLFASGVLWSVVGLLSELRGDIKHPVVELLLYAAVAGTTFDARAAVVRGETRLVPLTARSYLVLVLLSFVGYTAYGACSKHKRSNRAHPGAQVGAVDGG